MRADTPQEPTTTAAAAAAASTAVSADITAAVTAAEREDAGEIWTLQRAAYLSEAQLYGDPYLPALTEGEEQVRAAFDRGPVLKAVRGGRIVGAVRGVASERTFLVNRLAVAPDARRGGIGRALMAALERRALQDRPGLERFVLSTGHGSEANLRLCRGLGYTEASRERMADHLTLVHLSKAVPEGATAHPG